MPDDQGLKKLSTEQLQLIFLVVAAILLALSLIFGIFSGFGNARARAEFDSVDKIKTALKFYNADQGRFPTQNEFLSQRILVPDYLTEMPTFISQGGACKNFTNLSYSQTNQQNFALVFCLEQSAGGLSSGIHILTNKGVAQ